MKNTKKTLKAMKASPLFTRSLLPRGNGKLLDYDDDNGFAYRYAQFNTRALIDCPFKSEGCAAVCYATKGNHQFPSVKASRERAFEVSRRSDFSRVIKYTIRVLKKTRRYKDAVMLLRIHESGDFYSVQYLRKWLQVFKAFEKNGGVVFIFYTKSFRFFNMLNNEEKNLIRRMQKKGLLAISASLDDTTTKAQREECLKMIAALPLTNIYYATEKVEAVKHDNDCDCANCAKCGHCNHATGKVTAVKIHSASANDLAKYRASVAS